MVVVAVNKIIPTAGDIIAAFAAHVEKTDQGEELRDDIDRADMALAHLCQLHDNFCDKIERFGPEIPSKYLNGHEFSVRNRCLGDGRDPDNCGRWFVKVSALRLLHDVVLATDIDFE
jgi:hypothetical protein